MHLIHWPNLTRPLSTGGTHWPATVLIWSDLFADEPPDQPLTWPDPVDRWYRQTSRWAGLATTAVWGSASGGSARGWTCTSTTACPPRTERSSTPSVSTRTSSGWRCWRRPMPSEWQNSTGGRYYRTLARLAGCRKLWWAAEAQRGCVSHREGDCSDSPRGWTRACGNRYRDRYGFPIPG